MTTRFPIILQSLVILAGTLAVAGCQTSSAKNDRPLLPILGKLQLSANPPLVLLGGPIPTDTTDPSVRLLGACFPRDQTIDLEEAFHLANVENPTIGLAEEIVQSNRADRMLARSLLFPSLNAGTTLYVHQGALMTGTGRIEDVNRQSLYLGAGADVRGAGPVNVPGIRLIANLGDAVFAPRVAQQQVESSQWDAAATRNRVLLDVANAYLALLGAEARLLAFQQSESEYAGIAKLTADFAATGQGKESDAQRARSDLLLLQTAEQTAKEELVLWNSELSRLLSLDPSVRLRPRAGTPPLIQLIDSHIPLERLIESAVAYRPEIAARGADVARNQIRLRQEWVRPFVPTVSIGLSAGDYGGGSNLVDYRFGHFAGRTDVDVFAVWTVQNLGFGNLAIQNRVRAEIGQAVANRGLSINLVRDQVAEAYAQANASRTQMEIDRRRVASAQEGYRLDFLRAKNLEGRFIEIHNSLDLLSAARQDLVTSMVRFSQSQFQLYVAIGGMPSKIDLNAAPHP